MAERILSDKAIDDLKTNIKVNGGTPVSEDLHELEEYLQKNPPNTEYLNN